MTNARIHDDHHIAHYCGAEKLSGEWPTREALQPRRRDRGCLSVNWLEHFQDASTLEERLARVRATTAITLRPKARYAVLNVGVAKIVAKARARVALCVKHDPDDENVSHALIKGYEDWQEAGARPAKNMQFAAALQQVVLSVHPAVLPQLSGDPAGTSAQAASGGRSRDGGASAG